MIFTIKGKHIEITDAIRKHAEDKTSKFPRYYNNVSQVEVILDQTAAGIKVEIIARAEHSEVFVVSETGQDAYTCIDLAVHRLQEKLRRRKTKQRAPKHPERKNKV